MNTLVRDAVIAGAGLAVGVGATLSAVFIKNRKSVSKSEKLRRKSEKLKDEAEKLRVAANEAARADME